jgi:hypothetical protein
MQARRLWRKAVKSQLLHWKAAEERRLVTNNGLNISGESPQLAGKRECSGPEADEANTSVGLEQSNEEGVEWQFYLAEPGFYSKKRLCEHCTLVNIFLKEIFL